jgi:hypothetical protein
MADPGTSARRSASILTYASFEADDVIGTLTAKAHAAGFDGPSSPATRTSSSW